MPSAAPAIVLVHYGSPELTRRCLASMVEVSPLSEPEAQRPRLPATEVHSLIATRRQETTPAV